MKIAFIINGSIKKLNKTIGSITTVFNSYDTKIYISDHAGHFSQLCKEVLDDKYDHIIFVGGDGSLNEGINGIIDYYRLNNKNRPDDYDWDAIGQIRVGVYPAGSGNDFVRTIYKDNELDSLKRTIDDRSYQMIDVGWVSFQNLKDQKDTRFFINITDVGMGGDTVRKKSNLPKWFGSSFSYFWAITSTLATYKKCSVRAYNDQFSWEGKVINMVVANGKYFGNGLGIAPGAKVTDGKFSFIIIGDINLLDYFKHLGSVKKCIKINHPKVSYDSFDEITIESTTTKRITIDMDGEYIGAAPMTLKCLSKKMKFITSAL